MRTCPFIEVDALESCGGCIGVTIRLLFTTAAAWRSLLVARAIHPTSTARNVRITLICVGIDIQIVFVVYNHDTCPTTTK
jgi:hypothetical protein